VDINGKIFLADFGLSRMMDDDALWETSATHAGGTVRWTAPELISGDVDAVTQEADVYAYAMTSYVRPSGHCRHAED
jgi:serine/threonine protein kinase